MMALVKRHPLLTYFVLAYGLTWPVIPLVSVSPLLGIPALFGPTLAAIIVVTLTQGKTGLKDLLSRLVRWRVGMRWYAVALDLPVILALTTAGAYLLLGGSAAIRLGGLSVLDLVVFVGMPDPTEKQGRDQPRSLLRRHTLPWRLHERPPPTEGTMKRPGRFHPGPDVARCSTLLGFDLDDLLGLGDFDVHYGLFLVYVFRGLVVGLYYDLGAVGHLAAQDHLAHGVFDHALQHAL